MKTILGISAFYHDSAASILIDGKIIAAAQEEILPELNMTQIILTMRLSLYFVTKFKIKSD